MEKNSPVGSISVVRKTPPVGFLVLLFFFLVACNGFVAWIVWHDIQTYSYVETPGKIVGGSIQKRWSSGGRKPRQRRLHFTAQVEYTYLVDGKSIKSEGIRFANSTSNTRHGAERILAVYPVGSEVTVYHDPVSPETSVLVRGINVSDVFWVLTMMFFNLVFLGLVCFKIFPDKGNALVGSIWQLVMRLFGKQSSV